MNSITIIVDFILLLLLESKVNLTNDSIDVISELLEYYKKANGRWNTDDESIYSKLTFIVETIIESIKNEDKIDVDKYIRILKIETVTNDDLDGDDEVKEIILDMIKSIIGLNNDESFEAIKNLKRSIYSLHKDEKVKRLLQSKIMRMNGRKKNTNHSSIMKELREEFDKMDDMKADKDTAIINEIDLTDIDDTEKIKELAASVVNKHIFRTGWKGINRMTQGGLRVPEFHSVAALTHNFKSGFTLSMFASLLLYNKPMKTDKKPLAIFLSFEDDIIPIFEFLYRFIHITDTGEVLDKIDIDTVEMIKAVSRRLQKTGFNVKILRIDPTEWSFTAMVNKIKKYSNSDYNVQIVEIDYLEKLPTVGLYSDGIMGSDKKMLVRKTRNFMASRKILSGSPWQLSPKASELKKDGLSNEHFLAHVADKQYYQGSSTLGNEIDLEFFTNIIDTKDNGSWLNVHMGKHKIPTVVEKRYKSYYLPFPKNGPIPADLHLNEEIGGYDIKNKNPFYE